MDQEKKILLCEDSPEGIFTAVYDGWKDGGRGYRIGIRTRMPDNYELFTSFSEIKTDSVKAGKVMRTVLMKLGSKPYESICLAASASDPDRGTAIYHVLRMALGYGRCNTRIMEELADPFVSKVFKMSIQVGREYHHFMGFVRFREIGNLFLFSKIRPEHDILPLLGPHFADRYPGENWMIYDEGKEKAIYHIRGRRECIIRSRIKLKLEGYALDGSEQYENLWKTFCTSISIEARANENLQRQMMPLKFRQNMTEFF